MYTQRNFDFNTPNSQDRVNPMISPKFSPVLCALSGFVYRVWSTSSVKMLSQESAVANTFCHILIERMNVYWNQLCAHFLNHDQNLHFWRHQSLVILCKRWKLSIWQVLVYFRIVYCARFLDIQLSHFFFTALHLNNCWRHSTLIQTLVLGKNFTDLASFN